MEKGSTPIIELYFSTFTMPKAKSTSQQEGGASAREVYEVTGDCVQAQKLLNKSDKYYEYNQCSLEAPTKPLGEWQTQFSSL